MIERVISSAKSVSWYGALEMLAPFGRQNSPQPAMRQYSGSSQRGPTHGIWALFAANEGSASTSGHIYHITRAESGDQGIKSDLFLLVYIATAASDGM